LQQRHASRGNSALQCHGFPRALLGTRMRDPDAFWSLQGSRRLQVLIRAREVP
jgi:hypothetical protein